jgi:hypothetical protein
MRPAAERTAGILQRLALGWRTMGFEGFRRVSNTVGTKRMLRCRPPRRNRESKETTMAAAAGRVAPTGTTTDAARSR